MKKEVTLEDLALMTKNGFDDMGKRFDEHDKGFDKIGQRLDRIEKNQESFKKDFSDIRFRMTELVHRDEFLQLEQRVRKLESKAS